MESFDSEERPSSLTDCGMASSWTSRKDVIAAQSKAFAISVVRKSTAYLPPEANFKSKIVPSVILLNWNNFTMFYW